MHAAVPPLLQMRPRSCTELQLQYITRRLAHSRARQSSSSSSSSRRCLRNSYLCGRLRTLCMRQSSS
jgi:hypothetical protein